MERALIEITSDPDGRWRWVYRRGDAAIAANEHYGSRAEAEAAARTAYPGVSVAARTPPANTSDDEPSGPWGWLIMMVALWRAARRG